MNHPNILAIHDVGKHDGSPYVVSEVLESETPTTVVLNWAADLKR